MIFVINGVDILVLESLVYLLLVIDDKIFWLGVVIFGLILLLVVRF